MVSSNCFTLVGYELGAMSPWFSPIEDDLNLPTEGERRQVAGRTLTATGRQARTSAWQACDDNRAPLILNRRRAAKQIGDS
jgi:hypothetical protein